MRVGIRGLRDQLSRHLDDVRNGHTITITDHGKPIARIVPIEKPTKLEQLIADGLVTPARQEANPLPPPVPTNEAVSDFGARPRR